MSSNDQNPADGFSVCGNANSVQGAAVSPQLRLLVPTYFGHRNHLLGVNGNDEFAEPDVAVLIHPADGIRIVLGTHDYEDYRAPDVQIERRPKRWAIFLRPSGGDPSGYLYFLDDGRSFLVREFGADAIQLIDGEASIPELDDLSEARGTPESFGDSASAHSSAKVLQKSEGRKCARCRQIVESSEDWYGDLCPQCADKTDGEWVCLICGDHGEFEAMGGDSVENPTCCGSSCEHLNPDELAE